MPVDPSELPASYQSQASSSTPTKAEKRKKTKAARPEVVLESDDDDDDVENAYNSKASKEVCPLQTTHIAQELILCKDISPRHNHRIGTTRLRRRRRRQRSLRSPRARSLQSFRLHLRHSQAQKDRTRPQFRNARPARHPHPLHRQRPHRRRPKTTPPQSPPPPYPLPPPRGRENRVEQSPFGGVPGAYGEVA